MVLNTQENGQESQGPEAQINREMDVESPPATPTQNQQTPSVFEIPILPLNKRYANFSPETTYRGRNPYQNTSSPKPIAKNAEQAIYWARDLILQASTMEESHIAQNKLLELLDVFRDYTETGRVANQITEKLSAKLAYHSATLANASQQATKTLKQATIAASNKAQPIAAQPTQKPAQSSYAAIAANNSNQAWTTVQPRKKQAQQAKKPASYYQTLVTLEDGQIISPLLVRNKINQAFQKAGIAGPVIQQVSTSRRNNLILTTTEGYSGEFLLKQVNTWQSQLPIKKAQPLESWTKLIVHGVPTTFDGAENLQLLHTEIPTYNKNQTIVGNPYWLSRSWKNKQTSSIVIAFKSEEEAKKIGTEVSQREEIGDHDAIAITIQEGRLKFNIYNVYNQKNAENIKTFQRLLANTQLPISTLLLIDANEHHPWWDPGCKTSQDGQLLADWIEDQDLSLLNTPGTATFFRPHLSRETTLDLTIATPDLAAKGETLETSFKGKCKAFRKALFPPPPSTALPSFNNHQEKEWEWPALSTTELERACSNKVKSSSPGPDALSQDIITAAYQAQPNTFFKAYSLLFNYGYHPTCWRRATGAILKKPSKPDYSTPKAYRVITLLSCLGKVTERIIAKRLGYLAETTNLLHDSQIGGRLKKSAIDAALLLVDQIQHQKQQGYTTSTVFLDVKGAFDHVSHNQFLDTLKRLGLPISLITWAKTFLSNRSLRLAFDGQIEEFSEINAGIPQGSPVSPIFFLIYIRDLFPQIDGFQLSYIDDISITTSSTSIKKNVKILQREVNKLVTKGKQLAIEFDIAKTELIHYTKNKRRKEIPLELPSKEKIYHKDTIKWLGVYLDNKLSFREHVAIRASQAKTAFNRLGRLANIDRGLSPFAIRQLYLACVTSIADYGSPIYWRNQSFIKDQLQPLHNAACRKVLGVFKTAPAIPTSIEASLPSPAVRLSQTNRKYALRAIQLAPTHPITKAIARLQKTTLQQSKQPNKPRQLRAITSSIPSTKEIEEIISYRFRPWDSLNYNISISKKSKEEEAAAHKDYIQTIEDNSIVIYSDASKTKDRDGIGVGLAVYNPNQEEIYAETKNIGEQQLVYNGELEGVTAAFEYAAKTAQKDQNIHVYADNQAAIYRLQSLSDKPGQQWVIRCQKAAKAILNRKAKIFLKWAPGHTDIEGNERADALAKEATKQTPKKSQTSLAFLGTKIKLLQRASQAEEWRKYREKNRTPKATTVEEALEIARNLVIQAANLAENNPTQQTSLLDLVEVFRDYTETGRVSKKNSAILGDQISSLSNVSKELRDKVRRLEKPIPAQPNQQGDRQTAALTQPISYAAIAAANKEQQWTTMQKKAPQKAKPSLKERQLVLVNQGGPAAFDALRLRNAFNQAFTLKGGVQSPVVASVTLSSKGNKVVTTTPAFTANYLLENQGIWKDLVAFKVAQPITSWFKIVVHRLPTNHGLEVIKEEIETFNKGLKVVGTPFWLTPESKRGQQSYGSACVAFATEEEALKAIRGKLYILGESLRAEKLRVINNLKQCSKCQGFGHLEARNSPATESALDLAIKVDARIVAVQEPWLPKGSSYENTRSTAHQDFTQILPTPKDTSLRPRVLFYIRKDLKGEVNPFISDDNDFLAIKVLASTSSLYIYNIYNEKSLQEGLNKTTIQRRLLQEILQPQSIILGDFNTHHPRWSLEERSPSTQAEELVEWIDTQDLTLLNTPGAGTFLRSHMRQESVLDLTFATSNTAASILDWQTIPETTFKETLGQEIKVLDLEKRLSTLPPCSNYTSRKLILGQNILLETKLDELGEDLTRAIQKALEKSTPLVNQKPKTKPWWTSELDSHKRDLSRAYRAYKKEAAKENNSSLYQWKQEYLRTKNRYLKAIQRAKQSHWEAFLQKDSPKEIFKALAYTKDNLSTRIPAIKGKESFTKKCKAFREDLFPPPPTTATPSFHIYRGDSRWTWPALTEDELSFACCKVKATSPGPDLISQEVIQKVYSAQPEALFRIYSTLFNLGYHPRCWRKAKGVILRKPNKPDYSIPKAYRVISLLNCLGKVLERLVARRLGALAETTDLLHPSQLGGRLKKSAIDAALLFYNNIQQQKRKQKTTTTIFLDIKGAFDHVSKNKLLEVMKDQGLPCCLLAWTKSFLEDRILQLSFDGQTEKPQVISTGTPQGSPASPILFLIYSKPLFNAIQTNANIYSSSYIDDLQISISSTSVRKNIKLLEKEIQNLFRLAEESAIQFDSSKTKLVNWTRSRKDQARVLTLPNQEIVQSKELVRWLGVYFDCSLKFKHHSLIRNQQASAAFHRLSRLANSNKGLSPRAREQQTALNQRQKLQNQACRKILGSFRTSPAIPSEVEAALCPPRVRLNNALRQYAFRARKLAPSHPLNIAITSNQGKQLERITRSISTALSDDSEEIKHYASMPWSSTMPYKTNISKKSKKIEAKHHKELLEDEYLLLIYSDASATKEGKGIGVGVAFYKGASLIAYEKVNIGYNQLVYNGELEGITLGLEKAFDLVDDYLEVRAAIFRLKTASDYPGQEWQLRCTIAAEKLQEKGILPTIQWVLGHQGVIGNERADALAKEATKLDPSSSRTSLAVIGTRIKQLGEREWLSYLGQYRRKAITLNPTTYAARYKWKTRKQIATPPTSREASSAFYQLKLGHCYLRDFLFKRGKVDSKVCPCNYRATQDPAHILLSCTLYKEARKKMQETTKDPLSLAFLLDTTVGVQATIAFIKETRAATQACNNYKALSVTSNKKDSLLDEGMEAGSLWTSTSEGNDQRGA
ncbi:hypothetical protein BM1_03963 [Bipolaris maydis]|nr:hypothetical protein BM1_03963 [Bipolaris maydis]